MYNQSLNLDISIGKKQILIFLNINEIPVAYCCCFLKIMLPGFKLLIKCIAEQILI